MKKNIVLMWIHNNICEMIDLESHHFGGLKINLYVRMIEMLQNGIV